MSDIQCLTFELVATCVHFQHDSIRRYRPSVVYALGGFSCDSQMSLQEGEAQDFGPALGKYFSLIGLYSNKDISYNTAPYMQLSFLMQTLNINVE